MLSASSDSCHATVKENPVTFGKLKLAAGGLALALALSACSPSPETVGELTKTSIQEVFRGDPRFAGTAIQVTQVRLSAAGEKQYEGMASVQFAGVTHEVPVKVVLDGLGIKWSTAPDAFAFVPNTPPAPQAPR